MLLFVKLLESQSVSMASILLHEPYVLPNDRILLQAGSEHFAFDKLCGLMPSVKYSGQTARIPDGFQPTDLLPGKHRHSTALPPLIKRCSNPFVCLSVCHMPLAQNRCIAGLWLL